MAITHLYKYREINKYNLEALFGDYVMLSSRKNFTDPLDSKIDIIAEIKKNNILSLVKNCPEEHKALIRSWFNFEKMILNKVGIKQLNDLTKKFNDMINEYGIYCFASSGDNKKMWESYAKDKHSRDPDGFCIEFISEPIPVQQVDYRDEIPKLKIKDFIKFFYGFPNVTEKDLAKKIHDSLYIKRRSFKFENEYRFVSTGRLKNLKDWREEKPYERNTISSIIFGISMPKECKKLIIKNFKDHCVFKQVVPGHLKSNRVIIEIFDPKNHL